MGGGASERGWVGAVLSFFFSNDRSLAFYLISVG